MNIQLSDHFTYQRLLRFTIPSIVMMILTSIYSIVDGLFVSNYVGKVPFAALNLMYPLITAISTIAFMFASGGSAVVAITLGEGRKQKAQEYFSMIIYITIVVGIVISAIAIAFMKPIALALGASAEMLDDCIVYGNILTFGLTAFMLQIIFQSFFVTAQKPQMSLKISILSGITNIILDYMFVVVFKWGLAGAGIATIIGQIVGAIIPLIYFARKNSSLLRLTKTKFYKRILIKTCTNGSSELMTNISSSIVNILYNFQLMRIAGENGISAYGVIMYASFIFSAIYLGYSIGSAPLVGYHYGAKNNSELKNLVKKSVRIILLAGVIMTVLAQMFAGSLSYLFVGYDSKLYQMTCHGFKIFAFSFLISGFNIWGSGFFTALGNGLVSAVLAFLRTFVFQVIVVLLLPHILGLNGIWLAVVVAEALALCVTIFFLIKKNREYHYF